MARRATAGARGKREGGRGEPRDPEELGRTTRHDHADAFIPDPEGGAPRMPDDLAESLGEEFVRSATTGANTGDEALEGFVSEEIGGPFVDTRASDEFGDDGEMNPEGATREPLPRAVHGLAEQPVDEGDTGGDEPGERKRG